MQAIGVQIDGGSLRWALIKWDGRRLRIQEMQIESLDKPVKLLYTKQRTLPIVSGLSCSDCMIRALSFSSSPSKKLLEALIVQAQTQLHLKPEEMLSVASYPHKTQQTTVYTTTYKTLDAHLEKFKRHHIDPERVSALSAAYLAFIKWKEPYLESYFLIHIGQSTSSCIWVEKGTLQNGYDVEVGIESLKSAFQEDRKKLISLKPRDDIDFSALKSGQYPTLAESARALRRDLSKLLCSFRCQRPLLFLGEIDAIGPFKDFLWESLRDFSREEVRLDLTSEERVFAGCSGLAIDYLLQRKAPLQFRKQDRIAPITWQKLGRLSLGLLFASLLFSAACYFAGSWCIQRREAELTRSLEGWAASKDSELRSEIFSGRNEVDHLIGRWLRLVNRHKKEYPFLMKAPRVAFVLNWLSTHPLIESFRQNGDPISFEQIRYQLESFPHLDALQDPYLAKVELEFTLQNPLHARQLHEAFLQDEDVVDTSREITWDVCPNRFKTSFYLRNSSYGSI